MEPKSETQLPCERVYLDYYDKLDIKKTTISDLLTKALSNHIKAMEPCKWFVGSGGYKPEVVLPFTRKLFFKVHFYELQEAYDITYMYKNEARDDTLYSSTYGNEVLRELTTLIPGYEQATYKEVLNTDGEIDHVHLNRQVEEKWNVIENKEKVMFMVLIGKSLLIRYVSNYN